MRIRRARLEDANAISRICCDTIKYVNSKDYTQKQIKAWLVANRVGKVREKIKNKTKDVFVLIDKNKILGMASLSLEEDELSSLYVKYNIHSKGIGTKLLKYVENYSKKKGVKTLKLHSTITAYKFYKNKGFKKIKKTHHNTSGLKIPCILMKKTL